MHSTQIKAEDLTEAVLKTIQIQIALVGNMSEIITKINQQPIVRTHSIQLERLLKTHKQELEKITCVTDNLYMDWKCGDITRAEYMRMKAKFEQQAVEVKQMIQKIETEITITQKGIGVNDPYLKTFLKHKNIQTLDRGLLLELIDTIHVHENNKIAIQLTFADQHKRMLEFMKENNKQHMATKDQVM